MADVMDSLEKAATEDRSYQLWWVTAGVIEALRQEGLESSASVKRLLGQVDLQIRRLVDEGERVIEADPPFELINSLLFYVARTTSRGRRVSEIRKAFSLADLMPQQHELAEARDSLSAPSIKLMQTVGAAIREDLTRVKDVLDIFVRTGLNRVEELTGQLDLLRKIGDTLGVLGVPALKDAVLSQEALLRDIAEGRAQPDEETLLGIAAILIEVESNLDGQLVSLVVENESAAGDTGDGLFRADLTGADLRAVADPKREAAESCAQELGIPSATNDPRWILDDPDIDAVVIATPDHWHAHQTVHACQAGKHVYVEKPASCTVAAGRAMDWLSALDTSAANKPPRGGCRRGRTSRACAARAPRAHHGPPSASWSARHARVGRPGRCCRPARRSTRPTRSGTADGDCP